MSTATPGRTLADTLAAITRAPCCRVLPPKRPAQNRLPPGTSDLADLHELRTLCSEVRLHEGSDYDWAVSTAPTAAGPILLGEPTAALVRADSPDDLTNTCFVIATDGHRSAAGFHIVIDLHQERAGRCYLATWESFGLVGEMPVVANGVVALLQWLLELSGNSPMQKLPQLGDAYDYDEAAETDC